jgi:hypothetical protein
MNAALNCLLSTSNKSFLTWEILNSMLGSSSLIWKNGHSQAFFIVYLELSSSLASPRKSRANFNYFCCIYADLSDLYICFLSCHGLGFFLLTPSVFVMIWSLLYCLFCAVSYLKSFWVWDNKCKLNVHVLGSVYGLSTFPGISVRFDWCSWYLLKLIFTLIGNTWKFPIW